MKGNLTKMESRRRMELSHAYHSAPVKIPIERDIPYTSSRKRHYFTMSAGGRKIFSLPDNSSVSKRLLPLRQ